MVQDLGLREQEALIALALRKTGIKLPDTMYGTLKDFVQEKLEATGMAFDAYLARLETDGELLAHFIQGITIGETYFFREEKQFRLLEQKILPELYGLHAGPVRLWSAACSTGEEAWSLAMLAQEVRDNLGSGAFMIRGTDLNPESVAAARKGIYTPNSLREDGSSYHGLARKHTRNGPAGTLRIKSDLAVHADFQPFNLIAGNLEDFPGPVQVIFLRNVLIYLEAKVREALVERLAAKLSYPGYLFMSSTEVALFSPACAELREDGDVYYFARLPHGTVKKNSCHEAPQAAKSPDRLPGLEDLAAFNKKRKSSTPSPAAASSSSSAKQPAASLPLATPPRLPAEAVSRTYERCFEMINGDSLAEARHLLSDLEKPDAQAWEPQDRVIWLYLSAYADMREGLTPLAIQGFGACLEVRSEFWPARYHRAILQAVHHPQAARRDFLRVIKDIDQCEGSAQPELEAFLEGFSPRYYRGISEKWITKLAASGAHHGLG